MSSSQFINFIGFNVAGQRFTTTKETILKEPASRIALMARGVLPTVKDDTGAIFLDRDAKYFQLVLNYLRDGWCSLPKTNEERKELLQEIRYYQLAGMEAWLRTQDVMGEAALRPQSPDPYSSPNASQSQHAAAATVSSPGSTGFYSTATIGSDPTGFHSLSHSNGGMPNAHSLGPAASPGGTFPIRSSFLTGPNQDLLTAGTFAGIRTSSIGGISGSAPQVLGLARTSISPELGYIASGSGTSGLQFSPVAVPARPATASAYIGAAAGSTPADMAAGYAAGFVAGQQQQYAADRRSMSPAEQLAPSGRISAAGEPAVSPVAKYLTCGAPLANDGFKWTSKYLQSNAKMQEVVNTLLELADLPPHPSLHAGKTSISISSECDHDRMSSLLGPANQGLDSGRFRYQVVRVKSTMGWSFEFSLRPSSDLALYDKYNIAEFLQDNWFVLTACMKDMYGVVMEEDNSARPKCVSCRRNNISLTLQKFF